MPQGELLPPLLRYDPLEWPDNTSPGTGREIKDGQTHYISNNKGGKHWWLSFLTASLRIKLWPLWDCSWYSHMHDDVIQWKHSPRYWLFVRGIHQSSVNSPHKGQWRGALMFSLICAWINGWVNKSYGWWFETPSRSLWRHCNGLSVHWNSFVVREPVNDTVTPLSNELWWLVV